MGNGSGDVPCDEDEAPPSDATGSACGPTFPFSTKIANSERNSD